MIFDVKLAWWLARGQGKRLGLFVLCVGIGVGARVAVGSFNGQIDRAVAREARQLLTADIEVSSTRPLSGRETAVIRSFLPSASRTQSMVNFLTMASNPRDQRSRLVELRGVEKAFPFYGQLRLAPDHPADLAAETPVAYAAPELFAPLNLKPGQTLRLGRADFRLAGTIQQEPGAAAFALGPRVLIGLGQVPKTCLVTPASRVRYSLLIALPDSRMSETVARQLRQALNGDTLGHVPLSVRSFKDSQQQISRFFDRLADYLRLISLMAMLLGGIGIASTIRGFLRENLDSIAVLRALGASAFRMQTVYLSQALGLGLAGSLAGAALGVIAEKAIPMLLSGLLPVTLESSLDAAAVGWGLFLGLATTALFTLLPLMEIPGIKPMALWREQTVGRMSGFWPWVMALAGGLFFAGIAALETRSFVIGPLFLAGLAVAAVLLMGWGRLILGPLARLRIHAPGFGVRHGLANLHRPGNSPLPAVLALGLAVVLLGLFAILQTSLIRDLQGGDRALPAPALFMIDIQSDQVDGLKNDLLQQKVPRFNFQPMVKARYMALNHQPLKPEPAKTREQEEDQAMRHREQNLSYRDRLSPDETLVQGKWMDPSASGDHPEASVEERFVKRLGAKLGDTLTFDIQGVALSARVTSVRRVRWNSFQPNFFILISPQALAGAPQTWIATVSGVDRSQRDRIQNGIVRTFPNVTLIDIANASQRVLRILDRMAWAIKFMAAFSLAAGLVVLLGIAASSSRERVRDSALLKVLGAGRATLAASLAVEFAALGAIASLGGLALSVFLGWGLVRRLFETELAVPWLYFVGLAVLVTALCSLTGVWACARVFTVKPLEVLREEGQT